MWPRRFECVAATPCADLSSKGDERSRRGICVASSRGEVAIMIASAGAVPRTSFLIRPGISLAQNWKS